MRARAYCGWVIPLVLMAGCTSPAQQFNQRGVALFNAGEYEAAQAEFTQAANRDASNADAFYNLASTYHRLGQLHQAEWDYAHCLALHSGHSKCHHAMVVLLLEQDRAEEAYASVRRWMGNSPGSPDPIVELAWLEKQAAKPEEARNLLQQAIALEPRHTRALTELGSLYESSNQSDRALVLYQRALATNPHQPEVARKVADLRGAATDQPSHGVQPPAIIADTPAQRRAARDLRYEVRQ